MKTVIKSIFAALMLISTGMHAQFSVNLSSETCTGNNNGSLTIHSPYGSWWAVAVVSGTDSTMYNVTGSDTLITNLSPDTYILHYLERPVTPDSSSSSVGGNSDPVTPASFHAYDTTVIVLPANAFVASFSSSDTVVNTNTTINFNNLNGDAVLFSWVFGDGGQDSIAYVSHGYSTAGTYTVQLTATNAQGCTSTASRVIQVNSPSIAQPNSADRSGPSYTARITSSEGAISIETTEQNSSVVRISAIDGGFVSEEQFNGTNHTISISTPGIYVVELINSGGEKKNFKVLVL